MCPFREGIRLAVLQLDIVACLEAKYATDRGRFRRVWAQSVVYEPDLPIRGRYLSVRVRVDADRVYGGSELPKGNLLNFWADQRHLSLCAQGGRLQAYPAPFPRGPLRCRWRPRTRELAARLSEAVDFFYPEHRL